MIYLDNAATTMPYGKVVEAVTGCLGEDYGNPSASYSFAHEARSSVWKAREALALLAGSDADEIYFTSGGTESDNTAVYGGAMYGLSKLRNTAPSFSITHDRHPYICGPKPSVITSKIEHPAVLNSMTRLEDMGFEVIRLDPDSEGRISPSDVSNAVSDRTVLISIMHANNEIGTIEDIASFGRIAREHGILFHTDAVQTLGHEHIDVKEMNIDLLSGSGHKFHGPKGTGILYVRRGIRLDPFIVGGGQENGFRSGTENVPGIVGMGVAADIAARCMDSDRQYISALRDRLFKRISEKTAGVFLNGCSLDTGNRLAGNLHLSFSGVEGTSLLIRLDMRGICCSTGSACSQGGDRPSHVMSAVCKDSERIRGSLRLSLSKFNTESEIDAAAEQISEEVSFLRSVSD